MDKEGLTNIISAKSPKNVYLIRYYSGNLTKIMFIMGQKNINYFDKYNCTKAQKNFLEVQSTISDVFLSLAKNFFSELL